MNNPDEESSFYVSLFQQNKYEIKILVCQLHLQDPAKCHEEKNKAVIARQARYIQSERMNMLMSLGCCQYSHLDGSTVLQVGH